MWRCSPLPLPFFFFLVTLAPSPPQAFPTLVTTTSYRRYPLDHLPSAGPIFVPVSRTCAPSLPGPPGGPLTGPSTSAPPHLYAPRIRFPRFLSYSESSVGETCVSTSRPPRARRTCSVRPCATAGARHRVTGAVRASDRKPANFGRPISLYHRWKVTLRLRFTFWSALVNHRKMVDGVCRPPPDHPCPPTPRFHRSCTLFTFAILPPPPRCATPSHNRVEDSLQLAFPPLPRFSWQPPPCLPDHFGPSARPTCTPP
jgi:hypothetical protein